MKKRTAFIALIVIHITIFMYGCTRFTFPTGVWECEKLKIMLDFDKASEIASAFGFIEEDGEIFTIACLVGAPGSMGIAYDSNEENFKYDHLDYIYKGLLSNKGTDKMIFRCSTYKGKPTSETFEGKTYVEFEFVKIE